MHDVFAVGGFSWLQLLWFNEPILYRIAHNFLLINMYKYLNESIMGCGSHLVAVLHCCTHCNPARTVHVRGLFFFVLFCFFQVFSKGYFEIHTHTVVIVELIKSQSDVVIFCKYYQAKRDE